MRLFAHSRIDLSDRAGSGRTQMWVWFLVLAILSGSTVRWWALRSDRLVAESRVLQLRAEFEAAAGPSAVGTSGLKPVASQSATIEPMLRAIRFDWNSELQVLDRLQSSSVEASGWIARRDTEEQQLVLAADSTAAVLTAVGSMNGERGSGRWYVAQIVETPSASNHRVKATLRRQ